MPSSIVQEMLNLIQRLKELFNFQPNDHIFSNLLHYRELLQYMHADVLILVQIREKNVKKLSILKVRLRLMQLLIHIGQQSRTKKKGAGYEKTGSIQSI